MSARRDEDVTNRVRFGATDDDLLPLTRCVCGAEFPSWECILHSPKDSEPRLMQCCGAQLYFRQTTRVYQVVE